MSLRLCRFDRLESTAAQPVEVPDFRALVSGWAPDAPFGWAQPAADKKSVPLFLPGTLKPGTTTRKKANIEAVTVGVFDLDDISHDDVCEIAMKLKAEGVNHMLRSTFSDKGDQTKPRRFRAILELTKPCPAEDWPDLWERLNAKYLKGLADPQTKDCSRFFYAPSRPASRNEEVYGFLEGEALDPGRLLAEPRPITALPRLEPEDGPVKMSQELLERMARKLLRRADPTMGKVLKLILEGREFAEKGFRDTTLWRVCLTIVENCPHVDPRSVVPFFRASLQAMAVESPRDALTEADVLEKLDRAKKQTLDKIAQQQAEATENMRQDIRRAFERVGIRDRFDPYTPDEIKWMSEELLRCREQDFHRYLVVVIESSAWFWIYDRYVGPFPLKNAGVVAHQLLVPAASAGFAREVETTKGPKPISTDDLLRRYATIGNEITYSAVEERARFDVESSTLILPACARRRDLRPQRHEDVEKWLRALAGEKRYWDLCEWLAAFPEWDHPLQAGLFIGDGGTGKSLLLDGLSNMFQNRNPCHLAEVLGSEKWNTELRMNLVCAAEEQAPMNSRGEARTAEIRDFISKRIHTIRTKYQPSANLIGAARVIMTANNDGMFANTHGLSPADIDAIQERFFMLQVQVEAKHYLKSLTSETRRAFAERKIAEHVLWLHANKEDYVDLSRRFLGPEPSQDFTDRMLVQSGSRANALHWIVSLLERPQQIGQSLMGFRFDEALNVLYANTGEMLKAWTLVSNALHVPSAHKLGHDLAALSKGARKGFRGANGRTYWAYPVDVEKICQWSERFGISSPEDIRTSLKAMAAQDAA